MSFTSYPYEKGSCSFRKLLSSTAEVGRRSYHEVQQRLSTEVVPAKSSWEQGDTVAAPDTNLLQI